MLESASPLQRLEKLEKTIIAMDDASRPTTHEDMSNPAAGRRVQETLPQQPRTREEKREALRKVLTDPAYMKDFQNPHAFPPTPDTVSTSMLRRGGQNSDDTLANQRISHERSYLALSEGTSTESASQEPFVEVVAPTTDDNTPRHSTAAQPTTAALLVSSSKRAFTGMTGGGSYFDSRIPPATQQRPRSADESTVSHRRGATRGANGWDTDSSADDDDAVSGYDYWLRESLRPTRDNLASSSAHHQHHGGGGSRPGYVSPDLFSFPSSGRNGGWASDAIFGLLGGSGYLGSAGGVAGGAPLSQTLDALGASLPHPQAGFYGSGLASHFSGGDDAVGGAFVQSPPPPNRRSSLHARTGSMSASGSGAATPVRHNHQVRKSPARAAAGVSRGNSAESSVVPHGRTQSLGSNSHHQPQQPQDAQAAAPKQRHYPPISNAGQAVRSRGLSNFFRRSTGGAPASVDAPVPSASAPPPAQTLFPVPASSSTPVAAAKSGTAQGGGGGGGSNANSPTISLVGVPSWGRRADLGAAADDERHSATPPPILRSRVPGRGSVSAAAADEGSGTRPAPAVYFDEHEGGALLTPEEKDLPAAVPVAGGLDVGGPADGAGGGGDVGSAAVEGGGRRRWFSLGRKASLRK